MAQTASQVLEAVQHICRVLGDPPLISFAMLDGRYHVTPLLFEIAQRQRGALRPAESRAQEQHQEGIVPQPTFGAAINGCQDRAGCGPLERGARTLVFDGKATNALAGIAFQHTSASVVLGHFSRCRSIVFLTAKQTADSNNVGSTR